jgi:catechol 2,3-dioxygenase-like lactoylglutathione lyase family enzyme
MPSLENLRKQAKLVLRWHRERHYPVAAAIRSALPRFRHLRDAEVLAATFRLGDAQELVARRHGFASWEALRKGIDAMQAPSDRPSSAAAITATAAQLFVADIAASCEFFTRRLGFEVVFVYGEPPFYAQVRRDRGLLNLRHLDSPAIDPARRDREALLSADFALESAEHLKRLFLEFEAAGVTFFQTLRREPWGASTFIVKDPDGNLLLFAAPAE